MPLWKNCSRTDLLAIGWYIRVMEALYEGVGLEGRGPAERVIALARSLMPKRVWQVGP